MYKYVQLCINMMLYISSYCRVPVDAECHGMSNHRCLTMLEPCLACAMLRYASMLSGTIYGLLMYFWSLVFDHSASATGAARWMYRIWHIMSQDFMNSFLLSFTVLVGIVWWCLALPCRRHFKVQTIICLILSRRRSTGFLSGHKRTSPYWKSRSDMLS